MINYAYPTEGGERFDPIHPTHPEFDDHDDYQQVMQAYRDILPFEAKKQKCRDESNRLETVVRGMLVRFKFETEDFQISYRVQGLWGTPRMNVHSFTKEIVTLYGDNSSRKRDAETRKEAETVITCQSRWGKIERAIVPIHKKRFLGIWSIHDITSQEFIEILQLIKKHNLDKGAVEYCI